MIWSNEHHYILSPLPQRKFKVQSHPQKPLIATMSQSICPSSVTLVVKSMATGTPPSSRRRTTTTANNNMSALEARVSLIFALASQTTSVSQRLLADLASETAKYVFPKRFESRNLEEALMSVPDLETVKFKVLSRNDQYEIRELEPYFVAETTMPGKYGFDLNGSSQSFNVLAEYLFGKNTANEAMEMTTPVLTRRTQSGGETLDMTTPVITKKMENEDKWKMSFVMPSKYGSNLPLPKNSAVTITQVPVRIVAVVAFSGFVTDEDVMQRESLLRETLMNDSQFKIKSGALVEVAQYNPPFTLPFTRRNEISIEVERKQD